MAFLIDRFWLPLLLAALIGFMVAWATCKRGERKPWLSSWLPLGLLVAAGGVIAAVDATLTGRYGMWLESALLMFGAYLGGCCIACRWRLAPTWSCSVRASDTRHLAREEPWPK